MDLRRYHYTDIDPASGRQVFPGFAPPTNLYPDNAGKTLQALAHFGAPLDALGVTVSDLTTPGMVVQIGLPPNRVDVLTAISGVDDFGAAWDARVEHIIRGRAIPFLDLERLRQNKRASGRRKDLADLERLGGYE